MNASILTAVIGGISALFVAAFSYLSNKRLEREAAWRIEKLAHYKILIGSLSGIILGESTEEGQRQFAKSCNDLHLFAPPAVINALHEFQKETRLANPDRTIERHDELLTKLLWEIRKDLNVNGSASERDFAAHLWASGVRPH